MATEYLMEKMNQLKGQLQGLHMERMNHQLIIRDAVEPTGNGNMDQQLKAQADGSKAQLLAVDRRISVREAELSALQAEWDAQKV
jgi:2-keto-3-deoxy-galactonokinase